MAPLKNYYFLAKPGIVYGNAITAIAGFILASRGHFNIGLFVAMLVGIALVMASGCVFNNYIDRGIDVAMARTKNRALVKGSIPVRHAIIYAVCLGAVGFGLLAAYTNWLTVGLAALGFVDYVVLYGIAKRKSVHGTLVGSIAGAVPIVVGYCAVTGRFDTGAWLLFAMLTIWQMPHFYAIAIYRAGDYAAAKIPVLPVKYGVRAAKIQMLVYIAGFILVAPLLTVLGYTGFFYLIIVTLFGLAWLRLAILGFRNAPGADEKWARKLFGFSLLVLLAFSFMIAVDGVR